MGRRESGRELKLPPAPSGRWEKRSQLPGDWELRTTYLQNTLADPSLPCWMWSKERNHAGLTTSKKKGHTHDSIGKNEKAGKVPQGLGDGFRKQTVSTY